MASKKPKDRLFPNDFWNRPEPSTDGDPDPNDNFAAVGRALTQWETLEQLIADLCLILSGIGEDADENKLFKRMFGAIDSSSSRRSLLRKTAEIYFWHLDTEKLMMEKLDDLLTNISSGSRRRDDIARRCRRLSNPQKRHRILSDTIPLQF